MINSVLTFGKNEDSELAKLAWLVRLRWAAILMLFTLAAPGYIFGYLNSAALVIFVGIICFLLLFNWLTQLIFVEPRKKITPFFICFQLTLDLLVLFSLLMISGGFTNPFVALFILNAGLGAVLIRGQFSWPYILICHALIVALQLDHLTNNLQQLDKNIFGLMFVMHLLVFSTWIVMRSLGNYLENQFNTRTQLRLRGERQDRLRALGALAAGFSHEFASPLTAAKLRLDRIQKNISSANSINDIKDDLNEARLSIAACEAVIEQMNSSQLDVRDFNLKNIPVAELISDVADSWKEEFPKAQLHLHIPSAAQLQVPPINFAQVLLNLLDNAYEASNSGTIHLHFKIENEVAHLIVDDEGPGFSDLVLQRQGEPFITTKENGTGLGLYVSTLFAQSMGGQMALTNKPISGAQVTLTWPVGAV